MNLYTRLSYESLVYIPGVRVLLVEKDHFIAANGYDLYKYDFIQNKWSLWSEVLDNKYPLLSKNVFCRRLFRAEISNLYKLNKSYLAIGKKGIFLKKSEDKSFRKVFHIQRGSRPLNICIAKSKVIYWGEYFANTSKQEVHIYKSSDDGESWSIAYTFKQSEINHIHGLYQDPFEDKIWVLTGDLESECIIGYTDDEFKSFQVVFRGGQEYRTCNLFFYKDYIVYSTDSQYIVNKVFLFDRINKHIKQVQDLQGSVIYGCQLGKYSFLSTVVEPSEINKSNRCHLWYSDNGISWRELTSYKKDYLPKTLFQFGAIRFPNYYLEDMNAGIYFTGRSVQMIDGGSVYIKIK